MVYILFTNADTLTMAKTQVLGNEIQSSASAPDIIAVTEINHKNYARLLRMTRKSMDSGLSMQI